MKHPLRLVKTNVAYRRLWIAEAVLKLGGGLRSIAIPWLVLELTGDPLQLGLALALGTTPDVLLAPVIGYYIDRLPRNRVMISAAATEAAVLALVPIAYLAGPLSVLHLYLVLILLSVTRSAYHNARETTLPTLVEDEDLDEANAHFYVAGMAISILFMVVGGVLTQYVGGVWTLAGAAVATALAVVPLTQVTAPVPEVTSLDGPGAVFADFLSEVTEGISIIRGTVVRDILLFGIGINLASAPFALLITTVSWDVFGFALAYGLLLGAFSGGKLVGNVLVNEIDWSRERKFASGILAVGGGALVVAVVGPLLAGAPEVIYLSMLALVLAILGGLEPLFNVPSDSLVQIAPDERARGKVITMTNATLQVPFPLSLLGAGALLSVLSPFVLFGISGAFLVALGVVALFRFGVVGRTDDPVRTSV